MQSSSLLLKSFITLILTFLTLSGCAPKQKAPQYEDLTPEQKVRIDQLQRELHAKFSKISTGSHHIRPTTKTPQPPPDPHISDATMQDKLAAFDSPGQGVNFVRTKKGLIANGAPFTDTEGKIETFGFDYNSGDITYVVFTGYNYLIKYMRYNSSQEPLTIATAQQKGKTWIVKTTTGKKFNGTQLIPVSCGFIIVRNEDAFYYKPGNETKFFSAEDGFHIANFQNGDVATTGYILIERNTDLNSGTNLIGKFASIGNSLGLNSKEDYKLVNILTNESYPIDIPMDSKQTNFYTECSKKNKFINKCDNLHSLESLYRQSGGKNYGHYYWRITWFNTDTGPILIAIENGLRKLNVTQLPSGQKITAFERTLGINSFDATQDRDGKISITATLGFSDETIDDLTSFYLIQLQALQSQNEQ